MKKVIILLVLSPIILFSQTNYEKALNFQNEVRKYYDLDPLKYDTNLSLQAQEWEFLVDFCSLVHKQTTLFDLL